MTTTNANPSNSKGKYTSLIIAISLFLLFELLVLGLNFYASRGLDDDAVSINLAGRQRMLSQRTAKIIMTMQVDATQGQYPADNQKELNKVANLFDTTLNGFLYGGEVTGGNEKPVNLQAVKTAHEKALVKEASAIWEPYKTLLQPLQNQAVPDALDLDKATNYAKQNNLKLLKLMNDLTTSLEASTKAKAAQLQLIQTVALVVSILLFLNIVFNALRKLRAADAQALKAEKETTEILNTVKEGLFLLDTDLNIGTQHSKSLGQILQRKVDANTPFLPILRTLVSADTYSASEDYIRLLLGGKVKENLVQSLNPLSEVRVVNQQDTTQAPHYLSFQFNRVVEDKEVLHLLVTVQDVTKQILQAQELENLKNQSAIPLDTLQKLLGSNQTQLGQFLGDAGHVLNSLNQTLSELGRGMPLQHQPKLHAAFRSIHSLKGEAGALTLNALQNHAHAFEIVLAKLRNHNDWDKEDLLALPVHLSAMYDEVNALQGVLDAVKGIYDQSAVQQLLPAQSISSALQEVASKVSQNQHKQVEVQSDIEALNQLTPAATQNVQQICIQLLRNAICHGIELPEVRQALNKPVQGKVNILAGSNGKQMHISMRDDGAGVVPAKIRGILIAKGLYTADQVSQMSDAQVIEQLFMPGFSTAEFATTDAGHGVGLDVVKANIEAMGGSIGIDSEEHVFTEFKLSFPLPTTKQNNA